MGLLVYIPAVLGILRYRFWAYWRWVVALFIWQAAVPFLFDGYGSLERPEGDGVVTQALRRITNDAPLMALEGFVVVVVFWGVAIYLVRKLYVEVAAAKVIAPAIKPVTNLRKGMELLPVTLALGFPSIRPCWPWTAWTAVNRRSRAEPIWMSRRRSIKRSR